MRLSNVKVTIAGLFSLALVAGCGSEKEESASLKMWVAPNAAQEVFWTAVTSEWNSIPGNKPVEFTTIPATGSSEEAVMSALASGTEPDITTNIFSGFAAQLHGLNQIVDFSKLEGYSELIEQRQMHNIMTSWDYDGAKPVIPIYVNPVMYWWRTDILKENGFDKIPTSYDEIYALSEKFTIPNKQYAVQVAAGKNWWDRWFDFVTFYYAQSDGMQYVENNQATYNNEAGLEVLGFIDKMFANKWANYDFGANDPLTTGELIGAVRGPWDISRYEQQHPEILKTIKLGPIPTKDGASDKKTATFADSKGLVLFKSSEMQDDAWKFINWVYSNPKFDLEWIKATSQPPARGDLTSNPIFSDYYKNNPLAKGFAEYVDVAIPSASTSETVAVQRSMTQMLERLIFTDSEIKNSVDTSVEEVNKLLGK
ncbi:ABC transporter substrate-binding protein [Psychromonas ossibalaenae]|uniref:ABC transporter substrate-binding protein n=1 Tax=Psychromonas ossibalaenae TaxID=444922 RepID=UPI000365B013|nr:ABC transporter substrate-binding protein [Psychromonas ossibalaenae]